MFTKLSKPLAIALLATTASFGLVACSETAPVTYTAEEVQAESERLYAWFDETFNEDINDSPLFLTFLGRKDRNDEIDDFSDAQSIKDNETIFSLKGIHTGGKSLGWDETCRFVDLKSPD